MLKSAQGLEIGCLARFRSRSFGFRDRRAANYTTRQMARQAVASRRRLVAREGSAPPTSGCRPDMILFHHRAEPVGCLAWICTKTIGVKARHAAVTPRGKRLVEPEVVATSPNRIKSPVPVCCGFGSRKNGGRERTCTSKAHRFSICGVCYSLLTTRPETGAPSRNLTGNLSLRRAAL